MGQGDEEDLLRSVALQNARSILLARRRAEQELIEAQEALELKTHELAHSLALVRATLECATDGIVVVDDGGKVTGFNENFLKMWGIPREAMNAVGDLESAFQRHQVHAEGRKGAGAAGTRQLAG